MVRTVLKYLNLFRVKYKVQLISVFRLNCIIIIVLYDHFMRIRFFKRIQSNKDHMFIWKKYKTLNVTQLVFGTFK